MQIDPYSRLKSSTAIDRNATQNEESGSVNLCGRREGRQHGEALSPDLENAEVGSYHGGSIAVLEERWTTK